MRELDFWNNSFYNSNSSSNSKKKQTINKIIKREPLKSKRWKTIMSLKKTHYLDSTI